MLSPGRTANVLPSSPSLSDSVRGGAAVVLVVVGTGAPVVGGGPDVEVDEVVELDVEVEVDDVVAELGCAAVPPHAAMASSRHDARAAGFTPPGLHRPD